MIIRRQLLPGSEDQNGFIATIEDTITKQQLADLEEFSHPKTEQIRLVAQHDMDNAAGYILEDNKGRLHKIGYKLYTELNLDKLFLPPVQLPKPTMTVEEALLVIVRFAPEYINSMEKDNPFNLPKDVVIAREVLGGRDTGMAILGMITQIFKTRTKESTQE